MPEQSEEDLRSSVEQLLLNEDSWGLVRVRLVALGPRAVPVVIDAVLRGGHDTKFVERALLALGELGGDDAEKFVASMLGHPDEMIKVAALSALRQIGKAEYAPAVTDLLSDASDAVRKESVKTLAEIGGETARERLAALAQSEEKEFIKEHAQRAAKAIEDRNA
jgi:HEAT repeat protein